MLLELVGFKSRYWVLRRVEGCGVDARFAAAGPGDLNRDPNLENYPNNGLPGYIDIDMVT